MTARVFFAVIAVLMLMPAARAEDFPARPIKILVGAPAGGTTDTMARAIADPMAAALKQPVLVENRPAPAATSRRPRSRNRRPTATRCW